MCVCAHARECVSVCERLCVRKESEKDKYTGRVREGWGSVRIEKIEIRK